MSSPEHSVKPKMAEGSTLGRQLRLLILGRLITAIMLLLAASLWTRGNLQGDSSWRATANLLLVVLGVTFVYALMLRFSRALVLQTRFQFFIDVLLVTWLVW